MHLCHPALCGALRCAGSLLCIPDSLEGSCFRSLCQAVSPSLPIQSTSGISPQPFLPSGPSCTPPNPARNLHLHEEPVVFFLRPSLLLFLPLLPSPWVSAFSTLLLTGGSVFPRVSLLPGSLEVYTLGFSLPGFPAPAELLFRELMKAPRSDNPLSPAGALQLSASLSISLGAGCVPTGTPSFGPLPPPIPLLPWRCRCGYVWESVF